MNSLTPAERVVEMVSEATGTDPLELAPLHGSIDPDALNEVVRSLANGVVFFEYADCSVTVQSDNTVHIDHQIPAD